MPIEFRLVPHRVYAHITVVEILQDGKMVAMIYPIGNVGIKLVSAHISEQEVEPGFVGIVIEDDGQGTWPPIPSIQVEFNPSPYLIDGNRIVKIDPDAPAKEE